jgi:hypothetical protein
VVADGRLLPATVLGADPLTGIAVLDVQGLGLSPLVAGGPTEPGLDVVAIGTVGGRFPGTMVEGIVSSTLGSLPERYPATVLIVTTAAPLEGMVGGPLVEAGTGEVVGLLVPGSSRWSGDLPSRRMPAPGGRPVTRQRGAGFRGADRHRRSGCCRIDRAGEGGLPYLGAALEPVTIEQASRLGLAVVGGMLVGAVVEGGPPIGPGSNRATSSSALRHPERSSPPAPCGPNRAGAWGGSDAGTAARWNEDGGGGGARGAATGGVAVAASSSRVGRLRRRFIFPDISR